jgi:pimeloyl-ACP methyl ester carboxylesterase
VGVSVALGGLVIVGVSVGADAMVVAGTRGPAGVDRLVGVGPLQDGMKNRAMTMKPMPVRNVQHFLPLILFMISSPCS